MSRILTLAIVALLAASSLVLVGSVSAQSTPKPSVPDFTLRLEHNTYDQPAVYVTDEYTAGQKLVTPANHDEITYIVITIKNQPFTPFKDLTAEKNSSQVKLCYWVQYKGHFSNNDWSTIVPTDQAFLKQSDSDYTFRSYNFNNTAVGGQIDFRVAAVVGYEWEWSYGVLLEGTSFKTLTSSDLSAVQTITITSDNSTKVTTSEPVATLTPPTPSVTSYTSISPTATPTQEGANSVIPQFGNWLAVTVVVLVVMIVLLVVVVGFMRRRIRVLERKLAP